MEEAIREVTLYREMNGELVFITKKYYDDEGSLLGSSVFNKHGELIYDSRYDENY